MSSAPPPDNGGSEALPPLAIVVTPAERDQVASLTVVEDTPSEGLSPRQDEMVFSDEERREAWSLSGYDDATPQEQPVALWIIGPSAVGKSTLANDIAPEMGIPLLRPGTGRPSIMAQEPNNVLDAVVVDGHFFREVHSTYKTWAKSDDWATAYPALKPLINQEKQRLQRSSLAERKHLIIPQTCLNLSRCLSGVQELIAAGYVNHVLAVTAPRDEVARRGYAREQATGKRYAPSEYEHSMAAVGPMVTASNGTYQVVKSIQQDLPPGMERFRHLKKEVLASGQCGSDPDLPMEALAG